LHKQPSGNIEIHTHHRPQLPPRQFLYFDKPDMLEVKLLGQFEIGLDGQPLEIPSRPAQSLLAFLIAE
jgi:hypothetical protein